MFSGKARSKTLSGDLKGDPLGQALSFLAKHKARLYLLTKDKHLSLFVRSISNEEKKSSSFDTMDMTGKHSTANIN